MKFLDHRGAFRLQVAQLVIQEVEYRYRNKKYWEFKTYCKSN